MTSDVILRRSREPFASRSLPPAAPREIGADRCEFGFALSRCDAGDDRAEALAVEVVAGRAPPPLVVAHPDRVRREEDHTAPVRCACVA